MLIQREQEWNISRKELLELVEIGILVEDDIEEATAVKFNPVSFWNSQNGEFDVYLTLSLVNPEIGVNNFVFTLNAPAWYELCWLDDR